ncbi:phage regulatory CII family protein [Histophilus somni]|uniref:phage regulatory CII family protein n=1 Tax=Histophilus somni TaxID=731 RepID=UPI00094AEF67|nr:phage regulatory CII family protein [Histophilus somni]
MNSKEIQRLLHRDCKNSSGGITSLAYTLEKSPNILSNKLNIDCEQNQLSFIEGLELMAMVRSRATLAAIAAEQGYLLVSIPECQRSGVDKLSEVLNLSAETGELCSEYRNAISADSDLGERLSHAEKSKLLEILSRLQDSVQCLKWELEQ